MLPGRFRPTQILRHYRAGFSFLEILFAVLVLTFGIFGTMRILQTNTVANLRAVDRSCAVELARMKAAEFKAVGYARLLELMQGGEEFELPAASNPKPFQVDSRYTWRAHLQRSGDVIIYRINVFFRGSRLQSEELRTRLDSMEIAGQLSAKGDAQ